MKRILLPAALAFALAGSFAVSQQPQQAPAPIERHQHRAPDPQKMTARLSKRLNLSADQSAKIEPIFADSQQKTQALMANTQLAPEDKRQQFKAIHKAQQAQLATILTPDQLQQLQAMKHHRGGRRGEQGAPAPTA